MRELKEKRKVAVAPIFYILNRYATLRGKFKKTMKNGMVNSERYEEEYKFFGDYIGRHQDYGTWEAHLESSFRHPCNITDCRALASGLESEVLKCKGYTETNPNSNKTQLQLAEEVFKERMTPQDCFFQVNQNYTTTVWIIIALGSHYSILGLSISNWLNNDDENSIYWPIFCGGIIFLS